MRAMKSSGKWDDKAFERSKRGFTFYQPDIAEFPGPITVSLVQTDHGGHCERGLGRSGGLFVRRRGRSRTLETLATRAQTRRPRLCRSEWWANAGRFGEH